MSGPLPTWKLQGSLTALPYRAQAPCTSTAADKGGVTTVSVVAAVACTGSSIPTGCVNWLPYLLDKGAWLAPNGVQVKAVAVVLFSQPAELGFMIPRVLCGS